MNQRKAAPWGIWLFLLGLWGLLVLMSFMPRGEVKIPYSEFRALLEGGKVIEVEISEEKIRGKALLRGPEGEREGDFVTVKVDDPDLVRDLMAHGVRFSGKERYTFWKGLLSWVIPLLLLVAFWGFILRRMGRGPEVMSIGRSRARIYAQRDMEVTFEDVADLQEAKEELREIVEFLRNPERFTRLGGKLPKGVLLVGPPGCGKTLLAKAVAGEAGVPFFSISGSEFVELFVGVGAARVRDLFRRAQQQAPSIIFIDELDALGKARGITPLVSHDEREQTLNQLLVEMDGFDPRRGLIVLAATNRPEILDPALLRPGRFDRQILVDRPDIRGREEILRVHARKVKIGTDVDFKALAAMTPGFVGADLANVVNEAALLAARRGKDQVGMAEFLEAVERVLTGLERKSRVMSEKERKIVAYHEIGHALVASCLPGADPVQKVSIIPRGIAALGYTLQRPTEDRYLMTRGELMAKLTCLLAGRAAEELVFGEVSTGAHDDLVKATDMARSMVLEYGMSEEIGLVAVREERPMFLPAAEPSLPKGFSEDMARRIDAEVRKILEAAYQKAKAILSERIDLLHLAAQRLMEKEVLEGEELRRLLEGDGACTKGE